MGVTLPVNVEKEAAIAGTAADKVKAIIDGASSEMKCKRVAVLERAEAVRFVAFPWGT